jgi:predicted transposase YdaD
MKSPSDAMSDAERAILDLLSRVEALEASRFYREILAENKAGLAQIEARLAARMGGAYKERAGEREHAQPGPDTGEPGR